MGLGSFDAAIPPISPSVQGHTEDRGNRREPVPPQSESW